MEKIDPKNCITIKEHMKNKETNNEIKDDNMYMYIAEIFLHNNIAIKILKNTYGNEQLIYNKLQNHEYPNIVPIYGFIKCQDDFTNLKLNLMTRGICNGTDTKNIHLLMMDNISENNLNKIIIKDQQISVFYQLLFTSMKLFEDTNIIQHDIRESNITFIPTKINYISYTIKTLNITYIVKTFGIKPIIIDIDDGVYINEDKNNYLYLEDFYMLFTCIFSLYDLIDTDTMNILRDDINSKKYTYRNEYANKTRVINHVYNLVNKYVNIGKNVIINVK
jgi:hypothetical protein